MWGGLELSTSLSCHRESGSFKETSLCPLECCFCVGFLRKLRHRDMKRLFHCQSGSISEKPSLRHSVSRPRLCPHFNTLSDVPRTWLLFEALDGPQSSSQTLLSPDFISSVVLSVILSLPTIIPLCRNHSTVTKTHWVSPSISPSLAQTLPSPALPGCLCVP